jgi:hypothetical protein
MAARIIWIACSIGTRDREAAMSFQDAPLARRIRRHEIVDRWGRRLTDCLAHDPLQPAETAKHVTNASSLYER